MKAKRTTKKLLSLLLAALMLVMALPMSAIAAYATTADGNLEIGTEDAAGTVYTVYGTTDWGVIAAASAAGNTFEGMKIVLGADIGGADASNALTLAPLLPGSFAGTLEINSKTLKNISVSGRALLVADLTGTVDLTDVTITGVTLNATADASAIVVGNVKNAAGRVNADGLTMSGCSVTGTAYNNIAVFVAETVESSEVTLMNSAIDGDVAVKSQSGIVFGKINGTIIMDTVDVSGDITYTGTSGRMGGVIGSAAWGAILTMNKVHVKNTTISTAGTDAAPNLALFVGYVDGKKTTIKVTDCAASDSSVSTTGASAGGLIGRWNGYGSGASGLTLSLEVDGFTTNNVSFTAGNGNAGALIGMLKFTTDAKVAYATLKNIQLLGTTTIQAKSTCAAVIGSPQTSAAGQYVTVDGVRLGGTISITAGSATGALSGWNSFVAGSTLTVKNVSVLDDATVTVTGVSGTIGGLFGDLAGGGVYELSNLSVKNTTATTTTGSVGGVIGAVNNAAKLTVSNVELSNVTAKNTSVGDNTSYVGGVIGLLKAKSDFSLTNIRSIGTVAVGGGMVGIGGYGGVIGWYEPSVECELVLENIALTHLDMDTGYAKGALNAETNKNREWMGTGGIIGFYLAKAGSDLTMRNILLDGSVNATATGSGGGSTGGLIGSVTEASAKTHTAYDQYAGTITIQNCEMLLDITSTVKSLYQGTAGLIGSYGQSVNNNWLPDLHAENAVLNVENTIVGGSVTAASQGSAAVVGWVSFAGSAVNVKNTLFTGTVSTTNSTPSGLLFGRGLRLHLNVTLENCSSTSEVTYLAGDLGEQPGWVYNETDAKYELTGYTLKLNGVEYQGTTTIDKNTSDAEAQIFRCGFALQKDVVAIISAAEAEAMVAYAENGAIESVDGHLVGKYQQTASLNTETNTYSVRFVVLAHVADAASYQVTVLAKRASGDVLFDSLTCTPYDTLTGYNGIATVEYDAVEMGGKKFIAVVINNVPAGEEIDFEVTASYVTESGITVTDVTRTAHFDANGACTNATPVEPAA